MWILPATGKPPDKPVDSRGVGIHAKIHSDIALVGQVFAGVTNNETGEKSKQVPYLGKFLESGE